MTIDLVFWFALSVACDVSGQLCFKIGAHRLAADGELKDKVIATLKNYWLAGGLLIYVVETFVWLKILSVAPLSIAFPIASLNFLGVTLASATILGEKVGRPQWIGAWLVTIGVAVVASSG